MRVSPGVRAGRPLTHLQYSLSKAADSPGVRVQEGRKGPRPRPHARLCTHPRHLAAHARRPTQNQGLRKAVCCGRAPLEEGQGHQQQRDEGLGDSGQAVTPAGGHAGGQREEGVGRSECSSGVRAWVTAPAGRQGM